MIHRPLQKPSLSRCLSRPPFSIGSNWINYPEAKSYLNQRGLHDRALITELEIGYAPGGSLRRHLTAQGYSFNLLRQVGLLNVNGSDALYQRIVFPLRQDEHIVNLYGRSIGAAFAHRFLPGTKGGLYAWEKVRHCSEVILVEGLFDYAVLRQTGFHNVTCSLGTHLNADQFRQLCDGSAHCLSHLRCRCQPERPAGRRAVGSSSWRTRHHCPSRPAATGHDPNSFFVQGGNARQFQSLLEAAQP